MKLNRKQLRKMILQEIRLLKENAFPPVTDGEIDLPWRGEAPLTFSLPNKGENKVRANASGGEKVFYFYSPHDFTFNSRESTLSKCGGKDEQELFGEQCYKFRVVIPGDYGKITFKTTVPNQKFSIQAIGS